MIYWTEQSSQMDEKNKCQLPACPKCKQTMKVHGSYTRILTDEWGINKRIANLRVLECDRCKTTHRVLIPGMIPYKRISVSAICKIYQGSMECVYDDLKERRIRKWVDVFLAYTRQYFEAPQGSNNNALIEDEVEFWLKEIVNTGKWNEYLTYSRALRSEVNI